MKYLIVGSEGCLGKALSGLLSVLPGSTVVGVDKVAVSGSAKSLYHLIDVENSDELSSLIRNERPDIIFYLAGLFKAQSREKLFKVNCFAPLALLDVINDKNIRFVLTGSAAEYGIPSDDQPILETHPLAPVTDYGISKACQTFMVNRYAGGRNVVIARPFNLIGRGISKGLFIGHVASQIADIEKGLQPPVIKVGNIESYRDILPVDFAAKCLRVISEHGDAGQIYNVCSGQAVKMSQIIADLLQLSRSDIRIETDNARMRPNDPGYIVGSNEKLRKLFGGNLGDIEINRGIRETLEWFRENNK